MKLMRIALTGSLLLFLAACGNDSPVPPPTTTGGTTDGTTTGTTTGGTTGLPSTTGGTTTGGTTGVPTTTEGSTTGGTTGFPFPSTTGGSTTGGTTGLPTTTGGGTTGGTTGTISGTVTAPSGGDLTGAIVAACLQTDTDCVAPVGSQVSGTGAYTITGLQTAPYVVLALKDVDGSGTLTTGDYLGGYITDGQSLTPVTPPQTGVDITLVVYNGGGTNPTPGELTGTWTGTTTTQQYGTEQTTFLFTQSGSDISGTLTLVGEAEAPPNNPIEGTIDGSNVAVSSTYTVPLNDGTDGELEYAYEGTLSGTTLAGSVTLNLNGVAEETGSFSVTQGSASTAPLGKLDTRLLSRVFEGIR